jgi:CRP-like cAMP-binding protein
MTDHRQSPNLLLAGLSPPDFGLLLPHLKTVDLAAGATLVRAGEILRKAYFPHSGVIATTVALIDGRNVEVRIAGREEMVGGSLAGHRKSFATVVARLAGRSSAVDQVALQTVLDRSSALRALLDGHQAVQQAMSDQSVARNAVHGLPARLARRLLRLFKITGETSFMVTQEDMAEMMGVRRNAVSAAAHSMLEAGIIRYVRGKMELVDVDGLRRLSCECYDAVRSFRDFVESDEP